MKKIIKIIKTSSQKGVSLIELILYMAILSILLTILTSIFVSALDVQSESQATSSVEQDGNYILARLSFDIHRALSISIPTTTGGAVLNNFKIKIGNEDYIYSMDENNNLVLTNNSGANNLNNYGTMVSNLLVRRLGNGLGKIEDTLKINFTVTSRTQRISGAESKNFETNLSLRRQ